MTHTRRLDLVLLASVLLAAVGLKAHYAAASFEALAWVLWPTARLVELATGREFVAEAGSGYFSHELALVITPACAGVHHLIVCLLGLSFGFIAHFRTLRSKLAWLAAAAAVAYSSTLLANAARISWAASSSEPWLLGSLSHEALHRVQGVLVYFTSLLLVHWGASVAMGGRRSASARFLLPPLAAYWCVTLGVPVLRGSLADERFMSHAIVVLGLSTSLAGAAWLLRHFAPCARGLPLARALQRVAARPWQLDR